MSYLRFILTNINKYFKENLNVKSSAIFKHVLIHQEKRNDEKSLK